MLRFFGIGWTFMAVADGDSTPAKSAAVEKREREWEKINREMKDAEMVKREGKCWVGLGIKILMGLGFFLKGEIIKDLFVNRK